MPKVRDGKTSGVLRMTVAALLFFSCARITRPLASWTAGTSSDVVVHCLHVTRNVVLEVDAGCVKLIRPSVSRLREVLSAPSLTPSALQSYQERLIVSIWPEHQRLFFHRILPSMSDPAH